MNDPNDPIVLVEVNRLKRHCHPLRNTPWMGDKHGQARNYKRIRRMAQTAIWEVDSWSDERMLEGKRTDLDWHLRRIAYLIANPAPDPIVIDVGVPALGCYVDWIVADGNHRLAAAILRGDKYIRASVSGQIDYAEKILGKMLPA